MKWLGMALGLLTVQVTVADTAHVVYEHGIIFPQVLGGMNCGEFVKYKNEELGYSLLYSNGTFNCEVSMLTLGRSEIPDGHKGDGVALIFETVEQDLKRMAERGEISNLKKRGGSVVPGKSPLQFANAVFQYSEDREVEGAAATVRRISSVYVTGRYSTLVKVQFNFDADKGKQAHLIADKLIKQLVTALMAKPSEEELLLAACDVAINHPAGYPGQLAAQHVYAKIQTMEDLNFYDALFVWPQQGYRKPKNADFLVTAYFAGMLKTVLPQELETGGEVEAFEAMLTAYEQMRALDRIVPIAQLDEWVKAPDKKALYKKLLVEFGYAVE